MYANAAHQAHTPARQAAQRDTFGLSPGWHNAASPSFDSGLEGHGSINSCAQTPNVSLAGNNGSPAFPSLLGKHGRYLLAPASMNGLVSQEVLQTQVWCSCPSVAFACIIVQTVQQLCNDALTRKLRSSFLTTEGMLRWLNVDIDLDMVQVRQPCCQCMELQQQAALG